MAPWRQSAPPGVSAEDTPQNSRTGRTSTHRRVPVPAPVLSRGGAHGSDTGQQSSQQGIWETVMESDLTSVPGGPIQMLSQGHGCLQAHRTCSPRVTGPRRPLGRSYLAQTPPGGSTEAAIEGCAPGRGLCFCPTFLTRHHQCRPLSSPLPASPACGSPHPVYSRRRRGDRTPRHSLPADRPIHKLKRSVCVSLCAA